MRTSCERYTAPGQRCTGKAAFRVTCPDGEVDVCEECRTEFTHESYTVQRLESGCVLDWRRVIKPVNVSAGVKEDLDALVLLIPWTTSDDPWNDLCDLFVKAKELGLITEGEHRKLAYHLYRSGDPFK